jgi:transcriptional regulator with XRE-family HTH domain
MGFGNIDRQRGLRLRQAMAARGDLKMMAVAAELEVSPAALSKWRQGHAMSVDHARRLCELLGVSLDWLLTGTAAKEAEQPRPMSASERELFAMLGRRPARIVQRLVELVSEIPESAA